MVIIICAVTGTIHTPSMSPHLPVTPEEIIDASLGFRPPAPELFVPAFAAWPAEQPQPAAPAKLRVEPRPTMH